MIDFESFVTSKNTPFAGIRLVVVSIFRRPTQGHDFFQFHQKYSTLSRDNILILIAFRWMPVVFKTRPFGNKSG